MSKSDSPGDRVLFDEDGGLFTRADLKLVDGVSPVRVTVTESKVELSLHLAGGSVSSEMDADRAEQLGDALHEAAASLRDADTQADE
jgi:hypothetical protein